MKYTMKNIQTREKQIAGDYFVRFGDSGENKFEIETRLCDFLNDVYQNNFKDNTIVIISHGSITSYMKRILNLKSPHIKTGKVEEFVQVDFAPLFHHIKKLKYVELEKIRPRVEQVKSLNISEKLKKNLLKIAKKEFNNPEFSDMDFLDFISGITSSNLKQKNSSDFESNIILISFYQDFETFTEKWMNHYIDSGIKNFVLVDNHSTDNSTKILQKYKNEVNIDFWKLNEECSHHKICGYLQKILEFYGQGKQYLIVDCDELFIYENYKAITLKEFVKTKKVRNIKSLTLEIYPKGNIFEGKLTDYKFMDKSSYKITTAVPYKARYYGGPKFRVLNINSDLQKIPFISYTGNEVVISKNYCYPWNINSRVKLCSYMLHYMFLSDEKKSIKDKKHNISFYDQNISIDIEKIEYKF